METSIPEKIIEFTELQKAMLSSTYIVEEARLPNDYLSIGIGKIKRPTLEEFVESKYADEVHRAIFKDPIINGLMSELRKFMNTRNRPQLHSGVDANINIDKIEEYYNAIADHEALIRRRESDIKKHLIGNKLNSDMAVRAEYMEYINENFTDSESLKAMALMLYGEAAIRISECQPFADVSIQPKFNIADKHPKEFVFRDGRMEDIIKEATSINK